MEDRYTSRILTVSGVLAILIALGYTWWWLAFAYGARAGVERWAEDRRAHGWQVSYDDIALRGYPFVLVMRLRELHVVEPGRIDWQGPDVITTISPVAPTTIHVRAPGKHRLRLAGEPISFEAGTAQATFTLSISGRPTSGSVILQNVTATTTAGAASADALQVQIEEMGAPSGRTAEAIPNNLAFGLALSNLTLPSDLKLPLGHRLAAGALRGRLRGQWESITFNQALANWRDGGGVIELDELMLNWDPLTLSANGTLALDQHLQPLVAVTARMTGFFETVDALVSANLIRGRDASMAKMVLGLLSKHPNSGAPVLELPLTVQDGVFFAGPAALGKVPALPWEEPPPTVFPSSYPPVKRDEPAKSAERLQPGMTIGPQGEATRQK